MLPWIDDIFLYSKKQANIISENIKKVDIAILKIQDVEYKSFFSNKKKKMELILMNGIWVKM